MAKKCDYFKTREDGVILVKTYSTTKKYLKQLETGIDDYTEAVDIGVYENGKYRPLYYTYVETEKDIVYEENIKE